MANVDIKIDKIVPIFQRSDTNEFIKLEPRVDDQGIWIPVGPYCRSGDSPTYQMVMSKEMFVEAYNRYIKNPTSDDMK